MTELFGNRPVPDSRPDKCAVEESLMKNKSVTNRKDHRLL